MGHSIFNLFLKRKALSVIQLIPIRTLIPIRSAKPAVYIKHEKHRGGLPCGRGREAPEEHQRIA